MTLPGGKMSSARSNGRPSGKERYCMPAPKDPTLQLLREWIDKAENDLTAAGQILKLAQASPTATICFHAQQCVEKYLKAVLVHRGIPVPKTHNIQILMKLLPRGRRPGVTADEQKHLTNYAAVTPLRCTFLGMPRYNSQLLTSHPIEER